MADRPAERAAELVALQAVTRDCERVARVEDAVAKKLERVAVEFVSAVLSHDVHGRRRMLAVLRRNGASLDLEFLQRVRKWKRQIQVVEGVVVRCAIHQIDRK